MCRDLHQSQRHRVLERLLDLRKMLSKIPLEHPISSQFRSQQKRVKIVHVGAGAAGLITAYKARKMLKNYELICYDKSVC